TDPTPPAPPSSESTSSASVISMTTTAPPESPLDGDRFLVPSGATGAWSGQTGRVAEWDSTEGVWVFIDVPDGAIVYVVDSGTTVQVIGGVPAPFNSGGVSTVNSGTGISVDNTDPENPIINLSSSSIASLALADSAMQPGDNVADLTNDAGYLEIGRAACRGRAE